VAGGYAATATSCIKWPKQAFNTMKNIVTNSLGHRLCVTESNWSAPELGSLLVQLSAFVTASAGNDDLLKPLLALIEDPGSMKEKYLPTMEQV
jgi:hypothetical protein